MSVTHTADFLVIGAGISGASVAAQLSEHGSVCLLDAEAEAGYHSTGRSAALFTLNYGTSLIRRISALGFDFMNCPGETLPVAASSGLQLLSDLGLVSVSLPGQEDTLAPFLEAGGPSGSGNEIVQIDAQQVLELVPGLRPDKVSSGAYEAGVRRIDVAALHQAFLQKFKNHNGKLLLSARVRSLRRNAGQWQVETDTARCSAPLVVNAAGAWADEIGAMAGARPIGLVPKRRSVMIVDEPPGISMSSAPAVEFTTEEPYFKPDSGRLLVSLGEETPVPPQDIRPDELDIARLVEWLEQHTLCNVKRVEHTWAGLRSFVDDGNPVVGFDSECEGFFWLAAQGGYGIMMSEPLARASAGLIINQQLPNDFESAGIMGKDLSPLRIRA